jgi:glycosyltransferase involved in cell wall biosynthesis
MLCSNYVPHPGGLEVMVQNLSQRLALRHEVVLVTAGWSNSVGTTQEGGMTVHRLPAIHFAEKFGIPYPVPAGPGLKRALDALRGVEVVHAHGALYASSILGALVARRENAPLLLTEHVGFVEYRRAAVNAIQRAAWRAIGDRVVGATHTVATYNSRVQHWLQRRFPAKRLRYIGNGVDFAAFRPRSEDERTALRHSFGLPSDKPLLLYVGRETEKKNLDFVLQIPRDRFHLVVCGWKRDLRAAGVTDLGVLPHSRMPDLFAAVDAMVHASVGEGLPLAVQEGISSGLPVVLLWDEGYSGWISRDAVFAASTLEDLERGVHDVIGREDLRRSIGERARSWAESHWSWDATVHAYEEEYRNAIAGRAADA